MNNFFKITLLSWKFLSPFLSPLLVPYVSLNIWNCHLFKSLQKFCKKRLVSKKLGTKNIENYKKNLFIQTLLSEHWTYSQVFSYFAHLALPFPSDVFYQRNLKQFEIILKMFTSLKSNWPNCSTEHVYQKKTHFNFT